MKRVMVTGIVCLALGAAADRLLIMAAPGGGGAGGAATKPTFDMPPNEPGQGGMGQASLARLKSSTRHNEMIEIKVPGQEKPMKAMIAHPERPDKRRS